MKRRFTLYVCFLVGLSWGCEPEIDPVSLHSGALSIDRYVSIGDAYSVGATNGGIYRAGQEYSYPNLLAGQLREVQPLPFNQAYLGMNGTGYLTLARVRESACSDQLLVPTLVRESEDQSLFENISTSAPFHNLAIPELDMGTVLEENLGATNPFFNRMIPEGGNFSYADLIEQVQAKLYTVWVGLEMAWSFARNGHPKDSIGSDVVETFGSNLDTLISKIYRTQPQTTVLIGDIPDVTTFPFFTTVSHVYTDTLTCNMQPIYIQVETTPGTMRVREAEDADRILLSANAMIGIPVEGGGFLGLSEDFPLPDSLVLDQTEVQRVRSFIGGANQRIQERVSFYRESKPFPYQVKRVNLSQKLNNALQGQTLAGLDVSATYLTGGLFSIDGYTFSPRGNTLIANFIIEEINESFEAQVPPLNIADFEGVVFP
ncbi:MAG: hypothetical protein AAF694_09950 [Bacteroidota bacterium]